MLSKICGRNRLILSLSILDKKLKRGKKQWQWQSNFINNLLDEKRWSAGLCFERWPCRNPWGGGGGGNGHLIRWSQLKGRSPKTRTDRKEVEVAGRATCAYMIPLKHLIFWSLLVLSTTLVIIETSGASSTVADSNSLQLKHWPSPLLASFHGHRFARK